MIVEAEINTLKSKVFTKTNDRLTLRGYQAGVVLIAILLPLDRIGFLSALHLSIVTLLLLAQRWVYVKAERLLNKSDVVGPRYSYALLVPALMAILVQTLSPLDHPYNHAMFTIVLLAVRAFMIAQLLSREDLALFERVTYLVCAVVVAFGFYQYIADVLHAPLWVSGLSPQYASGWTFFFPRPQSTALEPLFLAFYLILPLSLLTLKVLKGVSLPRWQRIMLAATYGILIITLARGAIIGLVAALVVCGFGIHASRAALIQLAKIIAQGLLVALALTLFAGVVTGSNALGSFRSHAVDLNDESAQNRYKGISPAIRTFLERPLLGHGIVNDGDTDTSLKVNNSYLTILVEQGLAGMLGYAALGLLALAALFWSFRNHFTALYSPYIIAVLAMAIQANTFEAFQLLRSWVVLAVLVASLGLDTASRKAKTRA